MLTLLMIPALVALLLKLAVWYWIDQEKQSATFMALFLCLATQNLCEVLAYVQFSNGSATVALVKAYYVTCFFALCYMTFFAVRAATDWPQKIWLYSLLAVASIMSLVMVFTQAFMVGTLSIGYSLTAEHGPYYFIVRSLFIGQLMLCASILIYRVCSHENDELRVKSICALIALSPLLITSLGVNILQLMGFKFSASLVMPLATTLFLALMCYFEPKANMTRIRMYLPGSLEKKLSMDLFELASEYALEGSRMPDTKKDIERLLILYALKKHDHNVSHAAEFMGMERTTLYSAMSRHGIQRPKESKAL